MASQFSHPPDATINRGNVDDNVEEMSASDSTAPSGAAHRAGSLDTKEIRDQDMYALGFWVWWDDDIDGFPLAYRLHAIEIVLNDSCSKGEPGTTAIESEVQEHDNDDVESPELPATEMKR